MPTTIVANAITAILQARDMSGLMAEYDRLFPTSSRANAIYGVEKAEGVSIERARKEANERVLGVLQRVGNNAAMLTEEEKAILRQYSGLGGIGGSIHEYYTPTAIAESIAEVLCPMLPGLAGNDGVVGAPGPCPGLGRPLRMAWPSRSSAHSWPTTGQLTMRACS